MSDGRDDERDTAAHAHDADDRSQPPDVQHPGREAQGGRVTDLSRSPWRTALEEAWTASCEGSLPIGACVADASGQVLARGRNRLGEARGVAGVISGHDLAHAEINALLTLPAVPRPECRDWTVYTTVEPCPQCAGAVTMSGIRGLSYAAPDPWAGSADLLSEYPYMVSKGMRVGRAPDDVIRVALVLLVHAFIEEQHHTAVDGALHRFTTDYPAETQRAAQLDTAAPRRPRQAGRSAHGHHAGMTIRNRSSGTLHPRPCSCAPADVRCWTTIVVASPACPGDCR